jgi:hypothetical protein
MKRSMRKWSQKTGWRSHNGVIAALWMAAVLAACAQGSSSADLAPAAPQPAPAAVPASPPRGTLTPEEAKTQCWMKYEGDKKIKNIDQRLGLVEKCVDDTMRGQLVQAPQR